MKFPHLTLRCIPQRWVVSFECFCCLIVSYMMRFSFSLAITVMTEIYGAKFDPHSCPYPDQESATKNVTKEYEFHWTAFQQGIIHSSFFWGYITTQILGGVLSDLFDHKTVFLCGLSITCLLTALTPTVTRAFDWIGLIICRVLVGMAQGIFYNSLHSVTAHWIPTGERGLLGTLAFSGVQFGNAINTFLTGQLLGFLDWSIIFYIYALLGFSWVLIFFFTTYSHPSDVPAKYMSVKEQAIFQEYKADVERMKEHKKVPVKAILANHHVWAIAIGLFSHDWAHYATVTYIPTYMKSVLHLKVQMIGIVNASAYILLWIVAMLSAEIADCVTRKKLLSLTWNRRSLYLIGSILPALGFIGVSYTECNKILAIVLFVLGLSTLGMFYPSVKVNPMDLSPNFAGTIGAIGQMGGCSAGVIVPYLVGFLTPNSYRSEWRIVFWISFGVVLLGGIAFFFLASGEVQPFNDFKAAEKKTPTEN